MNFPMRNCLTEIYLKDGNVVIYHGGNMDNTEERSVRPNVDYMLGKGAYNKLRKVGTPWGSPGYMFTLTIPKDRFDAIVGCEPEQISK